MCDIFFLYTMPGYLTPVWDISILHPHPHIALAPMLAYPTELLFYDNSNTNVRLNKLPQTTIIFRIIEGTIYFDYAKIQTHALVSM